MDSLQQIVEKGDRKDSLVALRDLLASSVVVADPQYVAALARQLRDVLAELESLIPPEKSAADDLKAKRDSRLGGTQVSARTGGGK